MGVERPASHILRRIGAQHAFSQHAVIDGSRIFRRIFNKFTVNRLSQIQGTTTVGSGVAVKQAVFSIPPIEGSPVNGNMIVRENTVADRTAEHCPSHV